MKKPITIGVITVIATILIASAADFSAIGAKPIDQIHLETSSGQVNGIISCPDKTTLVTDAGGVFFTELQDPPRGSFSIQSNVEGPQEHFSVTIWQGSVQSNEFLLTGIGSTNPDLADFCGEDWPDLSVTTVWGECGQDVAVHFESENGYSGSFTGHVLCV